MQEQIERPVKIKNQLNKTLSEHTLLVNKDAKTINLRKIHPVSDILCSLQSTFVICEV